MPKPNRKVERVVVQVAEHIPTAGTLSDSSFRGCVTCYREVGDNWCYEWHIHTTDGTVYGFSGPMKSLPKPGSLVFLEPVKRGDKGWKFRDRWRIVKRGTKEKK